MVNKLIKFIFALMIIAILTCYGTCQGFAATSALEIKLTAKVSSYGANLSWNVTGGDSSNIAGYNLYRGESPDDISTVPITDFYILDKQYLDQYVAGGNIFYYTCRAIFQDGSLSSQSNILEVDIGNGTVRTVDSNTAAISLIGIAQGDVSSGAINLKADCTATLKRVEYYILPAGGSGNASPVVSSTDSNSWPAQYDSSKLKNGSYDILANGVKADGTIVYGGRVRISINNAQKTGTSEPENPAAVANLVKLPANGSVLDYSDITVSWNQASWAQKYKVTVENLESYRYVFSKELTAASIKVPKSSIDNWHQYKIWVAGIDKNGIQQSLGNPVVWVSHNYKQGDSGDFVKQIQERLIGKGYKLSDINGKFDSKTTEAVNAFKNGSSLLNTGDCYGVVGKDTWYRLKTGVWLAYGDSGDRVLSLKNMLVSLGYKTAGSDSGNSFGEGIQEAVNKFKADNKIYNDGAMRSIVGDQVWNLLIEKLGKTDTGVQAVNKLKNTARYIKDLVKQGKASLLYSTKIYDRQYDVYKVTGAYITESKSSPYGFALSANPQYRPGVDWKAKNHGYYFVDAKNNALVTNTDIIKKLEIIQNANFEFLLNVQIKKVGGDPFAQMLNDIRQTRSIRVASDFWKTWCEVCSNLTGNTLAGIATGGLGEAKALVKISVEAIEDVAKSKISLKTLLHGVCMGTFNICEDNICSIKTLHEKCEKYGYINDYNDAQLYLKYVTYMKVYYATSMFDDNVGGYTQDYGWWGYTKDTWGNFMGGLTSKAKELENVAEWKTKSAAFFEGIKKSQNIFEAMGIFDIECVDNYVKQINEYFQSTHEELNPDYFDSLTYKLVNDGQ